MKYFNFNYFKCSVNKQNLKNSLFITIAINIIFFILYCLFHSLQVFVFFIGVKASIVLFLWGWREWYLWMGRL